MVLSKTEALDTLTIEISFYFKLNFKFIFLVTLAIFQMLHSHLSSGATAFHIAAKKICYTHSDNADPGAVSLAQCDILDRAAFFLLKGTCTSLILTFSNLR